MTHEQTSALQHTPEAEALADAILKASGSALKHYSMQKTRAEIFSAAQAGIDTAQTELLDALEIALDRIIANNCDTDDEYQFTSKIREAIAKARGRVYAQ